MILLVDCLGRAHPGTQGLTAPLSQECRAILVALAAAHRVKDVNFDQGLLVVLIYGGGLHVTWP